MYKKPTEKGINVWRLEYHEGYFAAGNGIKFDDKNQTHGKKDIETEREVCMEMMRKMR